MLTVVILETQDRIESNKAALKREFAEQRRKDAERKDDRGAELAQVVLELLFKNQSEIIVTATRKNGRGSATVQTRFGEGKAGKDESCCHLSKPIGCAIKCDAPALFGLIARYVQIFVKHYTWCNNESYFAETMAEKEKTINSSLLEKYGIPVKKN